MIRNALTIGAVVAALILGLAGSLLNGADTDRERQRADRAQVRGDAAVAQIRSIGQAYVDVCRSTDPATVAQFEYLCTVAARVATQDEPDQVDTDALAAAAAAIVMAGLDARITAAVDRYMTAHPQTPAPSRDEVRAWVAAEVAALPPAKDGKPGKDGADGAPAPPVTDEQIDAAVARFMREHPPQLCPPDQVSESVVWRDGRAGSRCVVPEGG